MPPPKAQGRVATEAPEANISNGNDVRDFHTSGTGPSQNPPQPSKSNENATDVSRPVSPAASDHSDASMESHTLSGGVVGHIVPLRTKLEVEKGSQLSNS